MVYQEQRGKFLNPLEASDHSDSEHWEDNAIMVAGTYRLCWCGYEDEGALHHSMHTNWTRPLRSQNSCSQGEDFPTDLFTFEVGGPSRKGQDTQCAAGFACKLLAVIGHMLGKTDSIVVVPGRVRYNVAAPPGRCGDDKYDRRLLDGGNVRLRDDLSAYLNSSMLPSHIGGVWQICYCWRQYSKCDDDADFVAEVGELTVTAAQSSVGGKLTPTSGRAFTMQLVSRNFAPDGYVRIVDLENDGVMHTPVDREACKEVGRAHEQSHYVLEGALVTDRDLVAGTGDGVLKYFEQQSDLTYVEWQSEEAHGSNPFYGIDVGTNSRPIFEDYDGDGDADLIVGDGDGKLHYFENKGDGTYAEQAGSSNPFDGIDVGTNSVPTFADTDGDGDNDLVVGNGDGELKHFERTGSGALSEQGNPFAGVDVGTDSAPTAVDLDNDGNLDLVVGNGDGELKYFKNNGDGTFDEQTGSSNPFDGIDVGDGSNPAFVDQDGDGDLDLVVGDSDGTLKYFENDDTLSLSHSGRFTERTGPLEWTWGIDIGTNSAPTFVLYGDKDSPGVPGSTQELHTSRWWKDLEIHEGGPYVVCWCEYTGTTYLPFGTTDFGNHQQLMPCIPYGHFIVNGPQRVQNGTGAILDYVQRGYKFRFEIFGVGLDEHQRARIVDGNVACGKPAVLDQYGNVQKRGANENSGRYAGTLVDFPNDPGEVGTSGDPLTSRSWYWNVILYAQEYNVCWCGDRGDDCTNGEHFNVKVGSFWVLREDRPGDEDLRPDGTFKDGTRR